MLKEAINSLLIKIAEDLDIPDHVYEDAVLKYEDIGAWLCEDDAQELSHYNPEIYPQGSFRLGTVVCPIGKENEYDIDLICKLELTKELTTQKNLKQIVGDRLKKREDLKRIILPSRRCWVLDYPPQNQMPEFHMDVLPSIPNSERPPTGILLTDTELTRWQKSNPKAYSDWFFDRMKVSFTERRNALAESLQTANIEDVPEWQVKTPLQRAIQILKRHRDIYFPNIEDRPISIIITTLAAKAYRNQTNVYDALVDIIKDMPNFIENRDGQWLISNPVDSGENFADKWNEYPQRYHNFMSWLKKVREDLLIISQKQTLKEVANSLAPTLGQRTLTEAANSLGVRLSDNMPMALTNRIQVPALGDTQHCLPPAWAVQNIYNAKVRASVHRKENGKKIWDLGIQSVPKKVALRFEVDTDAPRPYEVRWQVVNTGQEALNANQLRGEFYNEDTPGKNIRWESTAYRGTHWVEAFVVKNGVCVAKSGRKMVKVW